MPDLFVIARRIYGAPLAAFVQSRKEEVRLLKNDGEDLAALVSTLRKPTVGAWVVNQLVRANPSLLDDIIDLGDRLRTAQAAADGAALRELNGERRSLVELCVNEARAVAKERDQLPTPAVLTDVEETLKAAMVDRDAAKMVREGLLVRALSPAGFGSVDLTDALALPGRARQHDEAEGADDSVDAAALIKARDQAQSARSATEAALHEAQTVRTQLDQARVTEARTEKKLIKLREKLSSAEDALRESRSRVADLYAQSTAAERAQHQAETAVVAADARVERLT